MAHTHRQPEAPQGPRARLVGLLAQFDQPEPLIEAADKAREAGYLKMDAYTPFPLPAIDDAIGIRRTVLPFIVLAIGLGACGFGLFMQYYANKADWSPLFPGYAFKISGKPLFSLPANIPVTFEVIVLSSAFASFFGMWLLNRLPRLANPLHRVPRFRRATNDRFFLLLEAGDSKFDSSRSRQQLEEWGATAIEEVHEDLTDHEFPRIIKFAGIILGCLLLVPPVLIYRNSGGTNRAPRLHVVPDMDYQHKYQAQQLGPVFNGKADHTGLFGDGRSMRPPLPGTFAIGHMAEDLEQQRGGGTPPDAIVSSGAGGHGQSAGQFHLQDAAPAAGAAQDPAAPPEPEWVTTFPPHIEISRKTIERGKARFEIYCSACHGYAGNGDGLVNQRAVALSATGQAAWTAAKSLHDPTVTVQPVGRIFDTITNGRNTMGPYRAQIPVDDRWAIVLYVKALQETGITPPVTAVPATDAAATPAVPPAQ